MSLLLITLPAGPPGPYPYVTSIDGQTLERHGHSPANLLPAAARGLDIVAVVPAAQLSWHRVRLPKGIGPTSPRLRQTLAGLLEDRVLDDAEQLHFAVASAPDADGQTWVAVCDRAWLRSHLQALDAAARPVQRIVPERAPSAAPLRADVVGTPEQPRVLLSGAGTVGGVQSLPLTAGTLGLLPSVLRTPDADGAADVELAAEPALAALAEQWLQRQPVIETSAQRTLRAARSMWDLAQADLARSGHARRTQRLTALWRDLLHAPAWRPARWGVLLLVLANLIGLTTYAWRVRSNLEARQALIHDALTQTFPHVKVVVDAPLQMEREVAALRQASGVSAARDLEPMLTALGSVLTPGRSAGTLHYSTGELRASGLGWSAEQLAAANGRLSALGYRVRQEGDDVIVALRENAP